MKNVMLIFLLGFIFSACQVEAEKEVPKKVTHVVICWLKEPKNKVQRAQLIQVSKDFLKIPGVMDVKAGEVIVSDRAVVDSTFDVAIVMSFASVEDLQKYLDHPEHVAAVKSVLKPLTSKVLVYDISEKP